MPRPQPIATPALIRVAVVDLGPDAAYMTYPDGLIELNTTLTREQQGACLAAALDRYAFPAGPGHEARPHLRLVAR